MAMIDHKLDSQLREAIKKLEEENVPTEIKWYVNYLKEVIEKRNKQIKEYQEVFDGIEKFTNRGPTVFG